MAKKRNIFFCSTVYDLKDLRAELVDMLQKSGEYTVVYSGSPRFPVKSKLHSHDICLDTVKKSDILILIISDRYGGIYAGTKYPKERISITWYEYKIAYQENIDIHTFVRKNVLDELPVYKANKSHGRSYKPFHVKKVEVFDFIDYITHRPKYNWIEPFDTVVDLKRTIARRLEITPKRLDKKEYGKLLSQGYLLNKSLHDLRHTKELLVINPQPTPDYPLIGSIEKTRTYLQDALEFTTKGVNKRDEKYIKRKIDYLNRVELLIMQNKFNFDKLNQKEFNKIEGDLVKISEKLNRLLN